MRIATHDIFDTLIARRCIEPRQVFHLMEQRSGRLGLAAARVAAEQQVGRSDYGLDDIYAALANRLQLDAATAEALQALELAIELEQVIPIRANLDRVRDGDLLVTDMYLPEDALRQLLARAGLRKRVGILRSAFGKGNGDSWRLLAEAGLAAEHRGDHAHSDVAMPESFGFTAAHATEAAPTAIEQLLIRNGLAGIALIARTLRLSIGETRPIERALAGLQAELNVPLLLVAGLALRHWAIEQERARVLFCSRDGHGWLALFEALEAIAPSGLDPDYFFTSRVARESMSPDYIAYLNGMAGSRGVLVDLCGTGLSTARMLARTGAEARSFLLFRIDQRELLAKTRQAYRHDGEIECASLLSSGPEAGPPTWETWEMINYAHHGMALDVRRVGDRFVPRLAECEFAPAEGALIDAMQAVVAAGADLVRHPFHADQLRAFDLHVPPPVLARVAAELWQAGGHNVVPRIAFDRTHQRANLSVLKQLFPRPSQ